MTTGLEERRNRVSVLSRINPRMSRPHACTRTHTRTHDSDDNGRIVFRVHARLRVPVRARARVLLYWLLW